jgi:drug/metabolite transporter (DMT)-like permease
MSFHYINPLICAFIFALASLFMKRGLTEGAGTTRTVFVTNACFFLALLPLWWIFPTEVTPALLWAPAAAGVVAFLGGVFQMMALKIGDVSVATPLLGGKVLFVALISTLILGNVLPFSWWIGAVLAGTGVFFLGQVPGATKSTNRLGLTILLSVFSVASFAMMDILIAGWGKQFGFQRFVVLQQVVTILLSLALIPLFKDSLWKMSRRCWPWLVGGSLLIVLQFYILNWTISTYKDPIAINIFYSSRGIWSVFLVVTVGPFLGNNERGHGWPILWRRSLGATLLFAAICLVVFENLVSL